MNIEDFYSADERRRQSAEIELGTNWFDAKGNRYELSWVEDTGELYTMLELVPEADSFTPFGDIEIENLPVDQLPTGSKSRYVRKLPHGTLVLKQ